MARFRMVWYGRAAGSGRAAYFSMYSRPALAKYCALGGLLSTPRVSAIIFMLRPIGLGRSVQLDLILPGCICSNPITSTQSTAPFFTRVRARWSPVDPVAHALFVL